MIHLLIYMSYLVHKIAATDECGKKGFGLVKGLLGKPSLKKNV